MKGKWKRDLLVALVLALLLGLASNYFWIRTGDVDELCHFRTDGKGLFAVDAIGTDVRCDPRWSMVLFGTTGHAVMLFVPLFVFIHGLRWTLHVLSTAARHLRRGQRNF